MTLTCVLRPYFCRKPYSVKWRFCVDKMRYQIWSRLALSSWLVPIRPVEGQMPQGQVANAPRAQARHTDAEGMWLVEEGGAEGAARQKGRDQDVSTAGRHARGAAPELGHPTKWCLLSSPHLSTPLRTLFAEAHFTLLCPLLVCVCVCVCKCVCVCVRARERASGGSST